MQQPSYGVPIMRILAGITIAALALSALPTQAADPFFEDTAAPRVGKSFYGALRGGIAMPEDVGPHILGDFDDLTMSAEYEDVGVFVAGAAGLALGGLRLEGEVGYFGADLDDDIEDDQLLLGLGDLDVLTLMANAYVDLDLGRFAPFIGAGIGVGFIDSDVPDDAAVAARLDDLDAAFAYQLTAGVGFDLSDTVTAELAYRFQHLRTQVSNFGGDADLDIETHLAFAGIRAKF